MEMGEEGREEENVNIYSKEQKKSKRMLFPTCLTTEVDPLSLL